MGNTSRSLGGAPVPQPTSLVFTPASLSGLTLRNRLIRAGCYEGLSREGGVTEALVDHHRRLAAGGLAMTTVGYCAVAPEGRSFRDELLMRKELVPGLRRLTEAVHAEGAAASIQLVHCGFFADPQVIGSKPLGASRKLCLYRLAVCTQMSSAQIEATIDDFTRAAEMAREAGFDAVELHAGHGYLLSQFISPWTNHRRDAFGGSPGNRLRFPAAVLRRLRASLGPGFPILVKMNVRDGMRGGLEPAEAVQAACCLEAEGASALIPSCGFTASTPLYMMRGAVPTREMAANRSDAVSRLTLRLFGRLFVQHYDFQPLFLLKEARQIRAAVRLPVVYVGGALSLEQVEQVLQEGFPFVQLGRATVRDPRFAARLQAGEIAASDCDQCNRCIAAMEAGGVYCVTEELEKR
jgi:2,4-dienoyl-CoA reductase-like NADH-dependent reductase (Old Yellow Enzyme family)